MDPKGAGGESKKDTAPATRYSGHRMSPTEEAFVAAFVQKARRERSLLELASESRRAKFLDRLCHDFGALLHPKCLSPISESTSEGVLALLRSRGAKGTAHVISSNDDVDGRELPLAEALRAVVGFGLPSIVICQADPLAYFEAEQVQGPPPRFLLVKQTASRRAP